MIPRLPIIAAVGEDNNTDPAAQRGSSPGAPLGELEEMGSTEPSTTFSGPNPVITGYDDPFFLQTYAEVELMLAEGAADSDLNVSTPQSAEAHNNDGVRAAINKYSRYGAQTNQQVVNDYVNNENPFRGSASEGQRLDQINTQDWAAFSRTASRRGQTGE